MDDSSSKPTFFERLVSRLSGETLTSAEAVVALLRQAHKQEIFDEETLQRLEKMLIFSDLEVRDAMVTRSQMDVIKANDSIERIIAYAVETAHSRFPVIEDDKDNVLGILHAKDLLKYTLHPEQFNLKSLLRPAVFIPEGKRLSTLLTEFREQRNHLAVVVDEYGGTSGLVTFEDVIEQIIGDIEDEFDDKGPQITKISDDSFLIDGLVSIDEINNRFELEIYSENYDTISGFIVDQLGYIPTQGEHEKIEYNQLVFEIVSMKEKRIEELKLTFPSNGKEIMEYPQ